MKVGNYQFELKGFKYLESRSEETYCFGAMLYVNGKKFADCGNGGYGGPTDVNVLPGCRTLRDEIEAFLKTQPKIKFDGSDFEMDFDLEYIVDTLVEEALKARELQRIKNKTKNSLVFKLPDGDYLIAGWKNRTIDSMLLNAQGREILQKTIAEHLAKGHKLINENIPSKLLPVKPSKIKQMKELKDYRPEEFGANKDEINSLIMEQASDCAIKRMEDRHSLPFEAFIEPDIEEGEEADEHTPTRYKEEFQDEYNNLYDEEYDRIATEIGFDFCTEDGIRESES